ncbi:MAG: hypothetical protein QOD45_448 [Pseudonocardiales bacterium]|nr:hypothetical protein [Pseudonocardiales bacterium]
MSYPAVVPERHELPRPPAAEIDSRRVAFVGTTLFLLGFLVLLPFYSWLGEHGHRVWLWTCLAGFLLGLCGYALAARHRGLGRTG